MKKYHAVVIEQSLQDRKVLEKFKILNTKHDGDWDLHILEIKDPYAAIRIIQPAMVTDDEFYWHIYDRGESLIVVFREKYFEMNPNNPKTWVEAQDYGKSLGIIPDQLEFYPLQFLDEPEWLAGRE